MKYIKFIILGAIMATFMSTLLSCKAIDDKAVVPIENSLLEKYGKSFTVAALGNRIGNDTATAYVYAEDEPEMRFIVRVNKNGDIVFENYAYRSVCHTVEKAMMDIFSANGLSAECFLEFSDCKYDVSANIAVDDYIKESGSNSISAAIIVRSDDKIGGEALETAITEIYTQIPEITLEFSLYILSQRDYDKIYEKIKSETQLFDFSRLRLYGIEDDVKEIYIEISNGKLSKTVDEINEKLTKEGE